ncbi:MAG: phosphatidate cytidylyltransferase [Ruminococcaceae bacterium]|nr:phosphatidate cytidylyltransferase [Oscillospiraceae bacterium]
MLTRILTAVVAVPLLIFLLWLNNTAVMLVVMTLASALAVGEILLATKYFSNKGVAAVCMIFVTAMPTFLCIDVLIPFFPMLAAAFLLIMFIIMLFDHENVKFEEISLMSFVSFLIPLSLSTIVFMQKGFDFGIYYVVLALLIPWISDAGAYFVGSAIGKHKMAPKISPKKSWEGFFGGLITAIITAFIVGFGYPWADGLINGEVTFTVNVLYIVVVSIIGSVLGVIGDFSASLLKRQCMVKDFGNIIPGHGGILDRFDSVLFVAPFLYLAFSFIEPVQMIA